MPDIAPPLGPQPFTFEPRKAPWEVAAFGRTFRLLTWVLLVGLGLWMLSLQQAHDSQAASWGIAAWLLMLLTAWNIQRSRTRLSPEGLHQSWIWNKQMAMSELAYAHLIRWRGLEWLVAPRLYVRNLTGKFTVIYCADSEMLDDMQRLSEELRAFYTH